MDIEFGCRFFYIEDEISEEYYPFFSDLYIVKLAEQIKECWSDIEVFTLALSPECCGGWDNAIRAAKIVTNVLDIDFPQI